MQWVRYIKKILAYQNFFLLACPFTWKIIIQSPSYPHFFYMKKYIALEKVELLKKLGYETKQIQIYLK